MSIANEIQQLYIGYLGRAADQAGLDYWIGKVNEGWSVTTVALSFADQPEYQAIYGAIADRVTLVTTTYNQLFDRAPDAEGLAYWTTGAGKAVADNLLVATFCNAALGDDLKMVQNKVDVSTIYTSQRGDSGHYDNAQAQQAIAGVTAAPGSVAQAIDIIDAFDGYTLSANAAAINEGQALVFTLNTTGVAAGTPIGYTITGTNNAAGLTQSGIFTVDASGKASVTVTPPANANVGDAGTLQLTLLNRAATSPIVTVHDASPSSFTVSATDIAVANIQNGGLVTLQVGDTGAKTVTLNTEATTATNGFLISGNGDITVNAGAMGDKITVVGNGANVVNAGTGTGNDRVTFIGTGTNIVNTGAGNDILTGGEGEDTFVFASGALSAADVVDGGAGNDTMTISGTDNVANAGNLANIEYLVMPGASLTVDADDLAGSSLLGITGSIDASVVNIIGDGSDTLDMASITLTGGLKNINVITGGLTLTLSADQVAHIGSITSNNVGGIGGAQPVTVLTTVAGYTAAQSITIGATVTLAVQDTLANILAAGDALAGVPVALGDVTAAEVMAAAGTGAILTYNLVDTAANLALAPVVAFNEAGSVEATTAATAAEAAAISTSLTVSNGIRATDLDAATITLNVSDTASMLANNGGGLALADTVTATTAATYAEAAAIFQAKPTANYAIADSAATLAANAANGALDVAADITLTTPATVAQIVAINAGSAVDVEAGYTLSDTFAALTGNAAVTSAAGNIVVTGGALTVANATAIEALNNTGSNSYVLADSLNLLLAAGSAVVADASSVSCDTNILTAAQMNNLVSKYGTAKLNDANTTVSDTVANLLSLTPNSVAESFAISIASGSASVQQIVELKALTGDKMPAYTVTDTATNLVTAVGVASKLALIDAATSVTVNGPVSVANIAAINTSLTALAGGLGTVAGYTLEDSAANLDAGAAQAVVDAAGHITVTGTATVAQIGNIEGGNGLVLGTDIVYALHDSAASVLGGGATTTAATSIAITDSSVSYAVAGQLDALTNFNDVYAIRDNVAGLPAASNALLEGASSVTLVDAIGNLFVAGVPVAEQAYADTVIAEDSLANLTAAHAGDKAAVDSFMITNPVSVATDVAAVNALSAMHPAVYTVAAATYAALTSVAAGVSTFVANAAGVTVSDALTVSQYTTLDTLTGGSISYSLTDTAANLAAAGAASAVAGATDPDGAGALNAVNVILTGTSANATVAQAEVLIARHITGFVISDTAANLTAAADGVLTAAGATAVIVSDNGETTFSVAEAVKVYDLGNGAIDGSARANYNLVDTAAALAAADTDLIGFAQDVTATTAATVAQANTLGALRPMGTTTFDVTGTAAELANVANDVGTNAARNLVASNAATVTEAVAIQAATNSGTVSYAISDSEMELALANTSGNAAKIAAIEAATGTVTVNDGPVSAANATLISALTHAVVYSVSDTAAALGASTVTAAALSEAVNITATGQATAAETVKLLAAANSGTTIIDAASMSSADAKALTLTSNDTITALTVTGTATLADALIIAAKDTGSNIGALAFSGTVTGSAVDVLAHSAVTALAASVAVSGQVSVADAAAIHALDVADGSTSYTYSITDSYSNLMANSDAVTAGANADVDAYAAIMAAAHVTVSDAVTIAQVNTLVDYVDNTAADVRFYEAVDTYNIVDNDANILAAMTVTPEILTGAATVKGYNNVALNFDTVDGALCLVGTRAQLDALSDVLQGAEKVYEVTVADLAANPAFFTSLDSTQAYRVTDTYANLTANALVGAAVEVVVTDNVTVAQANEIAALIPGHVATYNNLVDTAAALNGALGTVDHAVNVTATTAATFAQATAIEGRVNTGTTTYSIQDVDSAAPSAAAVLNGATNITITGTSGGFDATDAAAVLAATNSGTTTIAQISDTSAHLAALVKTGNDTITAVVATNNNSTVAEAQSMRALAGAATYSLVDTAEKLAADTATLNGATDITANTAATVAQATIIDAATPTVAHTHFEIADTASAILGATTALLAKDADTAIIVTDATVTAAVATQLRAFDAANANFTVAGAGGTGSYAISDLAANLVLAGNNAAVAAASAVTIGGVVTAANATAVRSAATVATAAGTVSYDVTDSYAQLTAYAAATNGARNVIVNTVLNVGQAALAKAWDDAGTDVTYSINDTAQAVSVGSADALAGATTITLSNAATVAQAGVISELTNVASYAIADSAAAVYDALNHINGTGVADRETMEGASSISLNTAATVEQVVGTAGANGAGEHRGLGTLDGVAYDISDTAGNIVNALNGSSASAITGATAVWLSDANVTISELTTLQTLGTQFKAYDNPGTAGTVEHIYNIVDSFGNIAVANASQVENANNVTANGTGGDDIINLSMFTHGLSINGGAGGDVITGGAGADTFSGGAGANRFVIGNTGSGITVATADTITDFAANADHLSLGVDATANTTTINGVQVADFAAALTAANAAFTGEAAGFEQEYYVAHDAANTYVFIDNGANGTAAEQVVVLTGIQVLTEANIIA